MALQLERRSNLPGQAATRPKLFSHGCLMCLKRRIKCDESRPSCKRCEKLTTPCPGYRSAKNLIFRDMNNITEKQVIKSKVTRTNKKQPNAANSLTVAPKPVADIVQALLIPNIEQQGVCYFVENYVFPGKGGGPGYLDFIPELIESRGSPAYLRNVLEATGMAALAVKQNRPEMLASARRALLKAQKGMIEAIRDPQAKTSDHFLAASFMCGKYQMLSGDTGELFEEHGSFQLKLVKLRGRSQTLSKVGRSLFFLVSSRAATRSVVELESTEEMDEELTLPKVFPEDVLLRMQQLLALAGQRMIKATRLVKDIRNQPDLLAGTLTGIMSDLFIIDRALEEWFSSLPPFLAPIEVDNEPELYIPGTNTAPYIPFLSKIFVFEDIMHSGMWTRYATARIQMLRVLEICLTACIAHDIEGFQPPSGLGYGSSGTTTDIQSVVQNRLKNFVYKDFAAVPFMLGILKSSTRNQHPMRKMAKLNIGPGFIKESKPIAIPDASQPVSPPTSISSDSSTDEMDSEKPFGKALAAFWLMWTLYPAGLVMSLPFEYHLWIEDRLLEIGHLWGVQQALRFRENLRSFRGAIVGFTCFPA